MKAVAWLAVALSLAGTAFVTALELGNIFVADR